VTVSIGMAQRQGGDTSGESIIKRADQALYRAKRDGRNRVVLDAA
jgi:two-component system cell cycle response regulator